MADGRDGMVPPLWGLGGFSEEVYCRKKMPQYKSPA